MTKKDYELIARVFAKRVDMANNIQNRASRVNHYAEIAQSLADALATENPRFDRDRFLKACTVT